MNSVNNLDLYYKENPHNDFDWIDKRFRTDFENQGFESWIELSHPNESEKPVLEFYCISVATKRTYCYGIQVDIPIILPITGGYIIFENEIYLPAIERLKYYINMRESIS